jgi:hypothetical protein
MGHLYWFSNSLSKAHGNAPAAEVVEVVVEVALVEVVVEVALVEVALVEVVLVSATTDSGDEGVPAGVPAAASLESSSSDSDCVGTGVRTGRDATRDGDAIVGTSVRSSAIVVLAAPNAGFDLGLGMSARTEHINTQHKKQQKNTQNNRQGQQM